MLICESTVPCADLLQLEGSWRGETGVLEWIIDQGEVVHRVFKPGRFADGKPGFGPQ